MSDSQRLQTDLIKVVDAGRLPDKSLGPRAAAIAIPSSAGAAKPARPSAAAGAAGIASPLTEPDYTTRTWHTAREVTTTDGIFTFVIEDIASLDMVDANGADVVLQFAEFAT